MEKKLTINEIKEKLNYFLLNNIEVHIKKKSGEFINGQLLQNLGNDVYSFMERKLGKIEVFVSEIFDIERCVKKEEMGE